MATLKELRERVERRRERVEEAERRVEEAVKLRRTTGRGYGETPWYTSGPVYRGMYADFLKEFTEARWSGSEEEEVRILNKYLNKKTKQGVSRENALKLLRNAWNRHVADSGAGEGIYSEY